MLILTEFRLILQLSPVFDSFARKLHMIRHRPSGGTVMAVSALTTGISMLISAPSVAGAGRPDKPPQQGPEAKKDSAAAVAAGRRQPGTAAKKAGGGDTPDQPAWSSHTAARSHALPRGRSGRCQVSCR